MDQQQQCPSVPSVAAPDAPLRPSARVQVAHPPLRDVRGELHSELREAVGRTRWRAWFRDVDVARWEGEALILAVPTEVHRTWIEYTYRDEVARAVARVLGEGVRVHLEVDARQDEKRTLRDLLPAGADAWEQALAARRAAQTLASFVPRPTDRWATLLLNSFVHGAAGEATLGGPVRAGGVAVVLHGPSGCGKSHLLRGLEAALHARAPGECLYLSAQQFTAGYVGALRHGDAAALRAFETDLLERRLVLLDGLERLEPRPATQAGLTRLLERSTLRGPRFVVAAREHPTELAGLAAGLRSRLLQGVQVRLATPDRATLASILAERGARVGRRPEPAIVEAVLDRAAGTAAALGLVERWSLASERTGCALPASWLDELAPCAAGSAADEVVRRAKQVVARHFAVDPACLERPTKARGAVLPRRVALYLAYRAASVTLKDLARAFGFRSHTSVGRALREVRAARAQDADLEQTLDGLLARL